MHSRFSLSLLLFLGLGCAGPFETRKSTWTVKEVKDWYAKNAQTEPSLSRGIIYEGSDPKYHHFTAHMRTVDNWAIIQIKKSDLKLKDERPYSHSSKNPSGYYYVNPSREFQANYDAK
jgi:hypothetical protein